MAMLIMSFLSLLGALPYYLESFQRALITTIMLIMSFLSLLVARPYYLESFRRALITTIGTLMIIHHTWALRYVRSEESSLFTFVISPYEDIPHLIQKLQGWKPHYKYAREALTSAQRILRKYSRVPNNGLIIYTGNGVSIGFEPFQLIDARSNRILGTFDIEPLTRLLEPDNVIIQALRWDRSFVMGLVVWSFVVFLACYYYLRYFLNALITTIGILKIMHHIKALRDVRSEQRNLFTLVITPYEEIADIIKELEGLKLYYRYAIEAITSAQQILGKYSRVPNNGLIIYTGNGVSIGFEPFKRIHIPSIRILDRFHMEPLTRLLGSEPFKYLYPIMVESFVVLLVGLVAYLVTRSTFKLMVGLVAYL